MPASRCAAWSWPRSLAAWSGISTLRWSPSRAVSVRSFGAWPPVTEFSVTRRGAAVAGKPPVRSLRCRLRAPERSKSGAPSCALLTCVASAREYEIGGWSSQSALARHADLGARPPPRHGPPAGET
jgi:hypothetical protein